MTKEIRTSILIKRNEILDKKKRSKLRHNIKRIEIKIIISNIHETRETIIYKRLSRRFTLQEMNTTKQILVQNLLVLDIKEKRTKISNRL